MRRTRRMTQHTGSHEWHREVMHDDEPDLDDDDDDNDDEDEEEEEERDILWSQEEDEKEQTVSVGGFTN